MLYNGFTSSTGEGAGGTHRHQVPSYSFQIAIGKISNHK